MRSIFLFILLFCLAQVTACETGFTGDAGFSGGNRSSDRKGSDGKEDAGDDAGDFDDIGHDNDGDSDHDGDSDLDSDGDGDSDGEDSDGEDSDDEDDIDIEEEDLCSSDGVFHIVMIFDNSASQSNKDLESMRQGATALVNSAASFVGKNNAPTIKLSTVRFNDNASIGANGWVDVAGGTAGILSDIQAATSDDDGDTYYGQAFNQAANLFDQVGTSKDKRNHRNFVLFFTDGDPDDDVPDILGTVNPLVNEKGVAVLAVGTGGDADDIQDTLSQLALPKTGIVAPEHVGSAQSASTQQAVVNSFTNLFQKVTDACD